MLRGLENEPAAASPDLLAGLARPDDAAVYRLKDGRALIATVDFFTPILDDPFQYGQVAAANAISDVYAMGGRPFLALSVTCFPDTLPVEILVEILRGAQAKVAEAGAVLAGGHSVRDAEPKFGLAVLGFAGEADLIFKGGARPGDLLYLTKAVGTGVLGTRLKAGSLEDDGPARLAAAMGELSAAASRAAVAAGVRGGTDVTGFALAGHALEMAEGAGLRLVVEWSRVPLLPGAARAVEEGFIPGGLRANDLAFAPKIEGLERIGGAGKALLFDPQTSGGLLLAVPPQTQDRFSEVLEKEGGRAWLIGRVEQGRGLLVLP